MTDAVSISWMLYGANGYTGRRIAEEAVHRGVRPILAGRTRSRLRPMADALDCPLRVFSLDNLDQVVAELSGCRAVLHCAGPFSATSRPMIDACMKAGVHYLDITGEIDVIEAAAKRHEEAVRAEIVLLPAVGFDVVPSDCLAAMLAARMPAATRLELAFAGVGPPSRGTLNTMLERLGRGGTVRHNGQIVSMPLAWKSMDVPFREGKRTVATIPWGDVATAWYSTGIPNIEVSMEMPAAQIRWIRRFRVFLSAVKLPLLRELAKPILQRFFTRRDTTPAGGTSSFWARVSNTDGESVEATLTGPEAYRLTVLTALAAVEKTLASSPTAGFSTPSKAFGPEFILEIPGTELQWR